MPQTRDLRRRIRATHNIRKVTHAMELVAATKMRRATAAMLATRRYAELAWELLRDVRSRTDVAHHPLLEERSPVRGVLYVVVTGNRGLVGAFHQRLIARALVSVRAEVVPVRVITAGRVGARMLQRAGLPPVADFPKKDLLAEPEDASPLATEALRQYLAGEADRVRLVYADYHSPSRQEPVVRTVLPVVAGEASVRDAAGPRRDGSLVDINHARPPEFLFEPSPQDVLRAVVPNLVAIQIYQALLETTASEHAARMLAMRNATENAGELLGDLTLTLNQVRQQQITRELQEIVAGTLVR